MIPYAGRPKPWWDRIVVPPGLRFQHHYDGVKGMELLSLDAEYMDYNCKLHMAYIGTYDTGGDVLTPMIAKIEAFIRETILNETTPPPTYPAPPPFDDAGSSVLADWSGPDPLPDPNS